MNSNDYELYVATLIEQGVVNGEHGLDPRATLVKHKPKYFSRDRACDITFDVSAEVTRPGETQPFFYWVLECKNYKHTVPVDDAEEFFAKLQQIGGANFKGTIISTAGFASGTVSYCQSKGIGLWRFDPNGERAMVVQADDLRTRAIVTGLTECDFTPMFFGLATNGFPSVQVEEIIECELWLIGQR
jgi:Restriction endonuclease